MLLQVEKDRLGRLEFFFQNDLVDVLRAFHICTIWLLCNGLFNNVMRSILEKSLSNASMKIEMKPLVSNRFSF